MFRGTLCALLVLATGGLAAREEPVIGWFDLAVPGGEATLRTLGLAPDERALTIPILARVLHDRDQQVRMAAALARLRMTTDEAAADGVAVPAPLDEETWRELLPPAQPPASQELFVRIVTDRHALLVAAGLVAADDAVREFLRRERGLLRFIYQHGAPAFVIVARRLQLANGRLIVPGGPGAERAWEALAGVAPARTDAFLRALLTKDQGRLAWYYDTIGSLDAGQLAAAWPAHLPPEERGAALYPAFRDPDPQWRIVDQPYRRGAIDAWMVVTQNTARDGQAAARGGQVAPLPQATWALLFANDSVSPAQVAQTLAAPAPEAAPGPGVPLPWLARETLSSVVRERRQRFEMFRLAQRVFANTPPATWLDVAVAVNGVRHCRALVRALERMQIRQPSTWAAIVRAARHVTEHSSDRRNALVAFQAVLALIERMRHVRTLDVAATTALLDSLALAVQADTRVMPGLTAWIVDALVPALPRLVRPDAWTGATAYESVLLQALAGPTERPVPLMEWEGLSYRVDPIAAEHDRLKAMRGLLSSPGLDAALASGAPRPLADALATLVYATALGDPEGPASLSPDVVGRHDFGVGGTNLMREELPWAPPEERQGYGPWHVQGALPGLDLSLSRLALRRMADQQMPQAPSLTLSDLGTLGRTVVGLVASDLDDRERDDLAAAIGRGRARLAAAHTLDQLTALARECGMWQSARHLLPWIASRQPETIASLFSLGDLFWLGHPTVPVDRLDRWGVAAEAFDGRGGLMMPRPASWEDYAGRSEVGQLMTQVPDLMLRLIEETATLGVPAALVPSLLAFAAEDFWHDVDARFADDRPRLTRAVAALSSTRIHDYVAALTGGGPLRAQ